MKAVCLVGECRLFCVSVEWGLTSGGPFWAGAPGLVQVCRISAPGNSLLASFFSSGSPAQLCLLPPARRAPRTGGEAEGRGREGRKAPGSCCSGLWACSRSSSSGECEFV